MPFSPIFFGFSSFSCSLSSEKAEKKKSEKKKKKTKQTTVSDTTTVWRSEGGKAEGGQEEDSAGENRTEQNRTEQNRTKRSIIISIVQEEHCVLSSLLYYVQWSVQQQRSAVQERSAEAGEGKGREGRKERETHKLATTESKFLGSVAYYCAAAADWREN